jgi:flagellar hook protein FlgE
MTLTNNVSSILAQQTLMDNSANNVANVNTDRFVPDSGVAQGGAGGSVEANLRSGTDSGSTTSQTDLSKEMTDQMAVEKTVDANAAAIRTQDQMYGSLLDITV